MSKIFTFSLFLTFIGVVAQAQTNFRTNQNGGGYWSDVSIWEVETPNGSGTWLPAGSTPTSASNNIAITSGDVVFIGANLTVDQLTVESGSVVIIEPGITLTVNNGAAATDVTFEPGSVLEASGRLTLNNNAVIAGLDGNADAYFLEGSFYRHLWTTTEGEIPLAYWDPNSTLEIFGYTASGADMTLVSTTWQQTFGNVIFDCPLGTGRTLNLNGMLTEIQGSLTITRSSLGNSGHINLTTGADAYITVGGDVNITGNARTYFNESADLIVDIGGNLTITAITTIASRFVTGGTTTINLAGDFIMNTSSAFNMSQGTGPAILNISGDFILQAGTLTEASASTGTGTLNFIGTDPAGQNFINQGTISQTIHYYIAPGTTLNMGTSLASGQGTFRADGNIRVGSTDAGGAISTNSGNIRVPAGASRIFTPGITIEYNGAGPQFLGTSFPADVNLVINNPNGVTLNTGAALTIAASRNLEITAGSNLSIATNTLTINGTISGVGTITGGGSPSNLTIGGTGSFGTLYFGGTQTINNFTINRAGDATIGTNLTVSGTLAQTDGDLTIDGSTLTINGAFSQNSGMQLLLANSPSVVIGGAGTLPTNVSFGGDLNINTLTINRTGTFTSSSNLAIVNALNLLNGTFNNTGSIGMQAGSTLTRTGGSLSNALANFGASQPFNIVYNNAVSISTGPEIPNLLADPDNNVLLNNLTKQNSGIVTLASNVEVNGTLTFAGGTFDAGSNVLLIKGDLVSNSASVLTSANTQFGGTTVVTGSVTPVFGNVNVLSTGSLTPNSTFQINGNLINDGTLNAGSGTTIFGGTTTISGSSISAFNNVTITGTLIAPSNSSFQVAGNWINNGTFTPTANSTVEFNGNSTINGTASTQFLNILISGVLTSPATLNVAGNFTDNGTFNAGANTVLFNGSSIQSIQGSSVTTFNNIDVTNTMGGPPAVQVQSNKNLRGILTLDPGVIFDADGSSNNAVFTLLSTDDDPAADAAIAALTGGAEVQGQVTVQRYMSIEGGSNGRIYRYISSPVSNAPVSQIQPELPVTGTFTGASVCSGCGTNQSMFAYDESIITDTNGNGINDVDDGYVDFPALSNTEIMTPGRGYAIFVRGNVAPVSVNGHARWDVRNTINSGTINFNSHVTYTSSGDNANDGWNLVGNPYPSTIDWDAPTGWTRTGINDAIYMRDNSSSNVVYATYINGASANGGSRYIPLGQAFYVKSDGGTIDFQATEEVKAPGNQAVFFRETPPADLLRITLIQGEVRDETVVRLHEEATDSYDSRFDAYKLKNSSFNLSTVADDGTKYVINSFSPEIGCGRVVNLEVSDVKPGTYQLFFSDFESFRSNQPITLRDAFTGNSISVREVNSYTFQVTSDPASFGAERFSVIISPVPVAQMSVNAPLNICSGDDAKITIPNTEKGYTYSVTAHGETVLTIEGTGKALELIVPNQKLAIGQNTLQIEAQRAACPDVKISGLAVVNVEEIQQAVIEVVDENTLASNYDAGNIWYLNGKQIPDYSGQYLDVNESGLYKLQVNVGGCVSFAEREFLYSVVEDGSLSVSVYPNPVKGRETLTIRTRNPDMKSVSIANSVGAEIGVVILEADESGEPGTYVGRFDIKQFPSGLYLIKVKDGDRFRVIKIINL